ncbi:MAG: glycine dehydrogenase subunit 1 [Chloroflexota bacterium]|nr:glycine dehydrogenase subunit 1 [Chloroflexota bacterium]
MIEHRYLPLSAEDRVAMLAAVGATAQLDLFEAIPADLRHELALPPGLSEAELVEHLGDLARGNQDLTRLSSFLGAGAYRRFIPAAVSQVMSRPEFFTAYTPYQAEASQGWLQSIFEFQSMIAELTAMDVANASMYEAASAMAEAAVMSVIESGRTRVVVAGAIHPEYLAVLRTYGAGRGFEVIQVPAADGLADLAAVEAALGDDAAALVMQQPNFLGLVEDEAGLCELAHRHGALAVVSADPVSLALLKPPGECGADIAVGECQQLGIPLWYGGPYCGYLAADKALLRKIPGRLTGETLDADGNRGYVLTLQAREQHIRRESASSNICTNQALVALGATAYLAVMGTAGLSRVAEVSTRRAHYLAEKLAAVPGYSLAHTGAYLWEFVLRCPGPAAETLARLRERGIIGGLDLGGDQAFGLGDPAAADQLLVAVTETNSVASLDAYVEALR